MDIKHLHVIINPAAGQNERILNTLNDVFNPAPFSWEVDITRRQGDATRLARKAAENGTSAVVVYGGDGTVVEVCNALAGTQVPVGILPGGTGNALALSLGIPQSLRQAAALIAEPSHHKVVKIDRGMVGDKGFVVGLLTGFMAKMIEGTARQSKDQLGLLAYTVSMLKEMQGYPPATYTLMLDNSETVTIEAAACNVLNIGTFGLGQISLVPESRATDGYLHVLAFENTTMGQVVSTLATAAAMDDLPFSLPRWKAKRVRIETDPKQPWMMDGEIIGETPIEAYIAERSLPVIVPHGADL